MPNIRVNFGACSVDHCDDDATVKGMCNKHYLKQRDVGECTFDGCTHRASAKGLCKTHYGRLARHGSASTNLKPPSGPLNWKIRPNGYVEARWKVGRKNYQLSQHRVVMEEKLGRPLRGIENVHHKNGVRHDNRPSNLELWVKYQPAGQRVEDLVVWAKEILEMYGDEVDLSTLLD